MTEEEHGGKPGEKNSRRKARRRRHRQGGILLAAVLFLLASGGGLYAKTHWTAIQAQFDILPDANARQGSLYGEAPRELDAGNFWVLVNQLPTLEEGSQTCNIRYENPSSNHYSARISLYLMETGELLGHTRRVDPGSYVEMIRIKKGLSPGEYPVRAVLELFEDKKPAGDMSLEMTLRVMEKSGADQPEKEDQPEKGGQPEMAGQLKGADQPEQGDQPEKAGQPKEEHQLETADQPNESDQNKESETG